MKYLATACLFLALACPVLAQCSGGSCSSSFRGTVVPSYVQPQAPVWEWRTIPSEPDHLYLFKNGVQMGCLHTTEGYFRPFDGNSWGPKGEVNVARIRAKPQELEVIQIGQSDPYPGGVDSSKISNKDRYHCRDHPNLSKTQALDMVNKIPDFKGKKFLTLIGPEQECKQVLDALNAPELADFKGKYIVNDFRPDQWQMRPGFVTNGTSGSPTILLQEPPNDKGYGKVLMQLDSFTGPASLAESLRKSDPSYNPLRNPNPLKPAPDDPDRLKPLQGSESTTPWLLLAAGGVAAFLFYRRNKQ